MFIAAGTPTLAGIAPLSAVPAAFPAAAVTAAEAVAKGAAEAATLDAAAFFTGTRS